jgi:class 3 adenylate cyclase/PAS domain-containing protein
MHYSAMGATYFYSVTGKATDHLALDQFWLSAGVTVITILIIILAVVAVVIDQRLQSATHLLRVTGRRMVEAIESISEGFVLYDADDRLVLCNKTYRNLWGYSDTEAAPGVHWDDLDRLDVERGTVIDQGSGMAGSPWRTALSRRRQRQSIEIQFTDGRWVTIRDRKTAAGGSVSIQTDITELKRAEQELAEKEAQLRIALDSMPGGMMLGDRDLNYVLFNSQHSELFDFPDGLVRVGGSLRDELRFQADRGDYGPGDKDELIEQVVAIYQRGEAVSYERTIAGSGRTLQIYVAPTPEGGYVTIASDITERKRREQELAEKESQLRLVLDSMPGLLVYTDEDLNIVLCNERFIEVYQAQREMLQPGQPYADLLRYWAEHGYFGEGDAEALVAERIESLRNPSGKTFEELGPDGRVRRVRRRRAAAGGTVTVVTDITEQKRAEEALLAAKQRSEDASKLVAEKNRMLESLSNQLSKYLSPQVYASIFSGEQSVEIASKRKKLTVFFSDIADFAGTTDSLESEELTNLLNRYLTEMSKIALDHGATIDKYVGDAIIAFFGDPETRGVKEDARACVNMAIAMQRRMRELRSEWLDMGLERPFQLRIGINTGFCTVGNFGSEDRMDYTIIGTEVNLAARLESHAEVGGILLAHETHSLVKDTVLAEEGDTLTVKGFAKPVRTYSVVGLYDDLTEQGRIIRKEQDGLALEIDQDKLTKKGKAEAIKALEEAVAQLKG